MRLRPSSCHQLELLAQSQVNPANERLEIVEAFAELSDTRRAAGKRHQVPLCLALFTLAVVAGNRGFLAIGDWLKSYHSELRSPVQATKRPTAFLQHHSSSTNCSGLQAVCRLSGQVFRHPTSTGRNPSS